MQQTASPLPPLDSLYGIGPVHETQAVDAGFSARNSVVRTAEQAYFLKQYRFTDPKRLRAAHAAKFFFADAGLPALKPLPTRGGHSFFEHDGRFYALFPHIRAKQIGRGRFSPRALESAADMLARLHRAGRGRLLPAVRDSGRRLRLAEDNFAARAERVLAIIRVKEEKSEFDRLAAEFIGLKTRLVAAYRPGDDPLGRMPFDHTIHGDYHDGNLFFDAADRVQWVFDWEKTTLAPRAAEVIRSMEYICFADIADYVPRFEEANFAAARRYLGAYDAGNRLPRAEFETAARAYYWGRVVELWVETEHYIDGNGRVDVFLKPRHTFVRYYAEHFDEWVERLAGALGG